VNHHRISHQHGIGSLKKLSHLTQLRLQRQVFLSIPSGLAAAGSDNPSHHVRCAPSSAGLFLPLGVFSAFLVARRGRPRNSALFLLLCTAALLATGCTVIHLNAKGQQTCTIQVTGNGASARLVESANVTLNIAQ
jgi:hypothetical protein